MSCEVLTETGNELLAPHVAIRPANQQERQRHQEEWDGDEDRDYHAAGGKKIRYTLLHNESPPDSQSCSLEVGA